LAQHDSGSGSRNQALQHGRILASSDCRRREAREDWILMRVATVVLALATAAFMLIMLLIIATHS